MTKRLFVLTLAIGLTFVFSGAALAADFSCSGEIVEIGCFKGQGAKGAGHAACAQKCLNDGKDMGLLLEDGSIVKLTKGDEDVYKAAIALAGQMAKVAGSEADGVVTIKSVEAAG